MLSTLVPDKAHFALSAGAPSAQYKPCFGSQRAILNSIKRWCFIRWYLRVRVTSRTAAQISVMSMLVFWDIKPCGTVNTEVSEKYAVFIIRAENESTMSLQTFVIYLQAYTTLQSRRPQSTSSYKSCRFQLACIWYYYKSTLNVTGRI
jgi:hypothetical protein